MSTSMTWFLSALSAILIFYVVLFYNSSERYKGDANAAFAIQMCVNQGGTISPDGTCMTR